MELRFGLHILTVLLCNFVLDAAFFTSLLSRDVAQRRPAHTLDRNLAVSGLILSGSACDLPNESQMLIVRLGRSKAEILGATVS